MRKREITSAGGRPLAVLLILSVGLLVGLTVWGGTDSYLQIRQFLSPQEIYVLGTGEKPDLATLNLVLEGIVPEGGLAIDCLLVLDVSASAKLADEQKVALDLVDLFSPTARVGLVAFSTGAQLVHPLSKDRAGLKTAIADLETGGKSAFGEALQLARETLVADGRDDALLLEILLTDGQSNVGRDPQLEASLVQEMGIKVVPIGIGSLINRNLLEDLARRSGGRFFPRPTDAMLEGIADLFNLAAQDIHIEKVLPEALMYVGAKPSPTQVRMDIDGATRLVWEIDDLPFGGQWTAQITLRAEERGTWPTDQKSFVQFRDFRGVEEKISVTSLDLAAIAPNRPPVAGFSYDPTAPTTTDVVQFTDRSQDPDGDRDVTTWGWTFGDGEISAEQNPGHRFSAKGTYTVTLVVVDRRGERSKPVEQTVTVDNSKPVALFVCDPKEPRVAVTTTLEASGSVDPDGQIVSYAWDFNGDGDIDVETSQSHVIHTFNEIGKITVSLHVTDNEGAIGVCEKALDVLPSVTATRQIETCLPDDETIAGATVHVTVTINVNAELHGLSLHEEIPTGWLLVPGDHGRATLRQETADWLFLETLVDGDVHVVHYTLIAPSTPLSGGTTTDGKERLTINGTVGSSSPRVSRAVRGEDKLTRLEALSIPLAISSWNTAENKLELCLPKEISFDQIQYAVALWVSGNPAPQTGGHKIDLETMQDLIAYWLTDTSVYEPLP